MITKLINALAEVLDVDLNDLQEMSEAQQLAHLEALQAQELVTVI